MIPFSSQPGPIDSQGPLALALHKFSYATNSTLQGKPVWIHLPQRDNIFAVFDHVHQKGQGGVLTKKELLKITRGGDLLEQIELQDLTYQARRDQDRMSSQSLQDSDRIIIIIVKKPLIALRYQLPGGQFRRMQMNFLPSSGYDVAFDVMGRLGLPIRDKNTITTPQLLLPTVLQDPTQRLYSSHQPNASSFNSSSLTFVNDLPGNHSAERLHSRLNDQSVVRPSSSQSVLDSETHSNGDGQGYTSLLPSPVILSRSEMSIVRPETRPSYKKDILSHQGIAVPTKPDISDNTIRRPWTAPVAISAETLTQMLPPKRVLPFPERKPKPVKEQQPEPARSASDDPSRPRKTAARKKATPKKRTAPQPKPAPAKAYLPKLSSPPIIPDLITQQQNLDLTSRPSSSTTIVPSSPPFRSDKNTKASGTNTRKTQDVGTTTRATQNTIDDPVDTEWIDRVNAFVKKYQDHSAPQHEPTAPLRPPLPAETASGDLAAYAALPQEERLAVLDKLILECIMDDDFVMLCKDVEQSWKRIGLGV